MNFLVQKSMLLFFTITFISDPSEGPVSAKKVALATRSWCDFLFSQALSRVRSQEDRENLVDDLFQRYEAGLIQEGRGNPNDIEHVHLVIQNTQEQIIH